MTASLQDFLSAFDRLDSDEQRAAVAELLRRIGTLDDLPFDDETLSRIAEEAFLEYDAREAADAECGPG